MNRLHTDASRGETKDSLVIEMCKVKMNTNLITIFCLYAMSLILYSPYEKYFESSRVISYNVIEILYACYTL